MRTRALPILIVSTALALLGSRWPQLSEGGVSDIGQTPFYAQTSWASTHRDSSNSDFVPFVAPDLDPNVDQTRWTALDGAVTLLAPAIGPEGNRYVTTGRGPGTSHLHAFDADGNLLWESAPQQSLADLDSGAVGSSPLVDKDGHVYVSDADQFWSFRSDGRVRWVAPLPPPNDPLVPGAPFISAILTNEGYVGGITSDGKVILFRRQNGKLALPIFELPQGVPPSSTNERPGLWAGGLMDPAILRFVEDWFFGDEAQVANTPSVHPETGRIYITAAGPLAPGTGDLTGLLYGLDIVDGAIEIAFAASMGGGSGTSPTISPDGTKVYAADNLGVLRAFDADTGDVVWSQSGIPLAGSPGLGADGTVYGGNAAPGATSTLVALDPADGSIKWARDYDAFAASLLPPLPVFLLPPQLQVLLPEPPADRAGQQRRIELGAEGLGGAHGRLRVPEPAHREQLLPAAPHGPGLDRSRRRLDPGLQRAARHAGGADLDRPGRHPASQLGIDPGLDQLLRHQPPPCRASAWGRPSSTPAHRWPASRCSSRSRSWTW